MNRNIDFLYKTAKYRKKLLEPVTSCTAHHLPDRFRNNDIRKEADGSSFEKAMAGTMMNDILIYTTKG